MLSGTIIVILISLAAGAAIRAWAFAIFAIVVALGFGTVAHQQASLLEAALYGLGVLALMQVCYVTGVFVAGIWRRGRKPAEESKIADPAPVPSKQRRS
jgi:bacteriorhodopsin